MDTVNASTFKTHFGEILTKASRGAVRITRRGVGAYVLIPESEYDSLKNRAHQLTADQQEALTRLEALSDESIDASALKSDRAGMILAKHARHT